MLKIAIKNKINRRSQNHLSWPFLWKVVAVISWRFSWQQMRDRFVHFSDTASLKSASSKIKAKLIKRGLFFSPFLSRVNYFLVLHENKSILRNENWNLLLGDFLRKRISLFFQQWFFVDRTRIFHFYMHLCSVFP